VLTSGIRDASAPWPARWGAIAQRVLCVHARVLQRCPSPLAPARGVAAWPQVLALAHASTSVPAPDLKLMSETTGNPLEFRPDQRLHVAPCVAVEITDRSGHFPPAVRILLASRLIRRDKNPVSESISNAS